MGTDTIENRHVSTLCSQCGITIYGDDRHWIIHKWSFCSPRCQRTWLKTPMRQRELSKFIAELKGR